VGFQDAADKGHNVRKSDSPIQERSDGRLVGARQGRTERSPAADHLEPERERREPDRVGRLEGQPARRARSSRGHGAARRSGYVSAYWIGIRMSGGPNWAMTEPSTNSTSE